MPETVPLNELGQMLLAPSQAGIVTDYEGARRLEAVAPNSYNAWTHVTPALARYAKQEGKRSFLGRDKGEKAYQDLTAKLRLVVLGLYADGLLSPGATPNSCLVATLQSLVDFKDVFPNWGDAYSAAYKTFVVRSDEMLPILRSLQKSVEQQLC